MMKKSFLTLSLYAALSLPVYAQSMPSLFIPVDPVTTGLAGSTIAKDAAACAVAVNASAMSFSDARFMSSLSYGMWQPSVADVSTFGAGAFFKMKDRAALGFTVSYILDKETPITNINGAVTGTYTPKDIVVRAGASYLLGESFSLGLSAKMLHSSISPEMSGNAISADLSAMFRKDIWRASVVLCNLGTSITYGSDKYAAPVLLKVGGSATMAGFTFSAEADYLFEGALSAAAGAEYCFADMAFARVGYHYGSSDKGLPSFASAGLGIKLYGISLDLAYLFLSETLRNSLNISIGYSF